MWKEKSNGWEVLANELFLVTWRLDSFEHVYSCTVHSSHNIWKSVYIINAVLVLFSSCKFCGNLITCGAMPLNSATTINKHASGSIKAKCKKQMCLGWKGMVSKREKIKAL